MLKNLSRSIPLNSRGASTSSFSEELIGSAIEVFQEEDGVLLSREEAIEALNSLGGLFLAFAGGRPVPTRLSARDGTLPVGKGVDSTLGVSNT